MHRARIAAVMALGICASGATMRARADGQIVVSANDGKATVTNGATAGLPNPSPDTVTVIDLRGGKEKVLGEVRAPTSVVGPPTSVAISPDGSIALVTACMRIDPTKPTELIPNDRVSVIDLTHGAPLVVATLRAGRGASGVAISPSGHLALVANRVDGTVTVFVIAGRNVQATAQIDFRAPDSLPSGVAFSADGRRAFVTRNGDNRISVLAIDGAKVTDTKADVPAPGKPYAIVVTKAGDLAVVGAVGGGTTGIDSLGLLDLTLPVPKMISQTPVGPTAEGLALSRDSRFVATTVMNGSNAPDGSPAFHDFGLLKVLALANRTLTPVAEAHVGRWCQGAAFSADDRRVLVQCMLDHQILVFGFDGRTLTRTGEIKVNGGPAGMAVAREP